MSGGRSLRLALQALRSSPSRTFLAASGVGVGVAAWVLLFGVGGGAERALQEALESMGKNLLAVGAARSESGALRGASRPYETLTLDDWRAIVGTLACVERAAPVSMQNLDLRYGKRALPSTVIGTTPEFRLTNNQSLVSGRFLDYLDVADSSRVAVVGAYVVRELFFGEQVLGQRLLVRGVPFVVIGILQEKGVDPTGAEEDNRVLVPVSTAHRRLMNVDYLDRIFVRAVSKDSLPVAEEAIGALLRERHAIDQATTAEDDFSVRSQAALLQAMDDTDRSFSSWLAGLAVLTLGLGGVGFGAVLLLSVRERRGEIGLHLAVGALPHHVLLQFLAEAVLVAALGGLGGLLCGTAGIIIGERLVGWRMALTWESVSYPFLIALGAALLFGALPALRAARLDPIVCLRS